MANHTIDIGNNANLSGASAVALGAHSIIVYNTYHIHHGDGSITQMVQEPDSEPDEDDEDDEDPLLQPAHGGQSSVAVVLYQFEAAEDNDSMSLVEGEHITQITKHDSGWWFGIGPGGKSGLFPSNYVKMVDVHPGDLISPVRPLASATSAASPTSPANGGPYPFTLHALYDYSATEDNQISFRAGDRIYHIEAVESAGWWLGTLHDGERGLFPENYVEIVDE